MAVTTIDTMRNDATFGLSAADQIRDDREQSEGGRVVPLPSGVAKGTREVDGELAFFARVADRPLRLHMAETGVPELPAPTRRRRTKQGAAQSASTGSQSAGRRRKASRPNP